MDEIFRKLRDYTLLPEGGRAVYGYISYCIIHTYAVKSKEWPMPIQAMIECRDHMARWYFIVKDESDFDPYLKDCAGNQDILKKIEETIITESEACVQKLSNSHLSEMTDDNLINMLLVYYSHFENMIRMAGRIRYLDRAVIYHFRKSHSNADEYLRAISTSDWITLITQEQIKILEIAKKTQINKLDIGSPEIMRCTQELHDQFTWTSAGYYNEKPKSIKDYTEAIKNASSENAEDKIDEIKDRHRKDLELRDKAIEGLSEDEKAYARIASTSTYLKDLYKYSVSKIIYFSEPVFEESANRTGKTAEYVKDLFPDQAVELIKKGKIDESVMKSRQNHVVLITHNDGVAVLTAGDAHQFSEKYLNIENATAIEFYGRIASKGKANGIAKIVLAPSGFAKFKDGDILVAVNTSPDFVPLMKMATAIVAEEGGLTSHTSVVSRELGVPCLVGVTNITSIIKDGDFVEVDAEKGIVKILKKA